MQHAWGIRYVTAFRYVSNSIRRVRDKSGNITQRAQHFPAICQVQFAIPDALNAVAHFGSPFPFHTQSTEKNP